MASYLYLVSTFEHGLLGVATSPQTAMEMLYQKVFFPNHIQAMLGALRSLREHEHVMFKTPKGKVVASVKRFQPNVSMGKEVTRRQFDYRKTKARGHHVDNWIDAEELATTPGH